MANKKYFIWIDERTFDFEENNCQFEPYIKKLNCNLIACDGSGVAGNLERGRQCIENTKSTLDEIFSKKLEPPTGIILDVNIPVDNLNGFCNKMDIDTYKGAYTGFLIAQYVLRNCDGSLSPYGAYFSRVPIIFLSVHQYQPNAYTNWMSSSYKEYKDGSKSFTEFTHLEKVFITKETGVAISNWAKHFIGS